MIRSIALLNQKGGVGKTTTTANLAAALALAGRKVAVVDLDPQAHLSLHLGVELGGERPSVYDLLIDDEVSVEDVAVEAKPDVWVIPAEVDLAAAEVELAAAPDRTQRLAKKIAASPLMQGVDFILMDCPPSLGVLSLNALAAVREVIVPMQAHFLALQGVSKLLETVGMVCRQVNPSLRVTGIVLSMHEGQTRLAGEVVADLDAYFESQREEPVPWKTCRVLRPAIRRNIKLAECPSFGQSIFEYDAACAGAQDYRELADRLLKEWDTFLERRQGREGEPATVQVRPGAGRGQSSKAEAAG